MVFVITVRPGQQITFQQTANSYDSAHELRFDQADGGCPGTNYISCVDDDDYTPVTWTNPYSSSKVIYYIQSGYSGSSGAFTFAWAFGPSGAQALSSRLR